VAGSCEQVNGPHSLKGGAFVKLRDNDLKEIFVPEEIQSIAHLTLRTLKIVTSNRHEERNILGKNHGLWKRSVRNSYIPFYVIMSGPQDLTKEKLQHKLGSIIFLRRCYFKRS
jgi:hypothetical protein